MGTWGTAIFSDDTASDVRDEFRDLIGEGLSTEQATDKLLREYAPSLDDPDDGPPFWLGLAVTQWKCGRLLEQVKEKALHIIDTGADLKRWSGDAKRRALLEKTRAQLLSPQPRPTPIRKRYQENNDWEAGELISYQTPRGKYAVLRVLGHGPSRRSSALGTLRPPHSAKPAVAAAGRWRYVEIPSRSCNAIVQTHLCGAGAAR